MSKQVEVPEGVQTYVALICKRCGGISDGPVAERSGVCICPDENEAHYEPTLVLRVSDLEAIYKHFSDRLREAAREECPTCEGTQKVYCGETFPRRAKCPDCKDGTVVNAAVLAALKATSTPEVDRG